MRNAGLGAQRNVIGGVEISGIPICKVCLVPISSQYPTCYTCGMRGPGPVPRVLFLTYSGITPQSVTDMMQYKGDRPARASLDRLRTLLYLALSRHGDCIRKAAGGIDLVTYVPSGKGSSSSLVNVIPAMRTPLFEMHYNPPYRTERANGFEVEKFGADPEIVTGKRVLLIEDSWFKGYNARSAAAALKDAGAASVTILVLARRLGEDYPLQAKLINAMDSERFYDMDFCPVSLSFHD